MIEITTKNENQHFLITVVGDADASSSIELDKVLKEAIAEGNRIILTDCDQLNYISSAGLGVFMSYIQEFQEKEITFMIYGLSEKVLNVFNILGLDQLLTIKKDKEEALAAINGL